MGVRCFLRSTLALLWAGVRSQESGESQIPHYRQLASPVLTGQKTSYVRLTRQDITLRYRLNLVMQCFSLECMNKQWPVSSWKLTCDGRLNASSFRCTINPLSPWKWARLAVLRHWCAGFTPHGAWYHQ